MAPALSHAGASPVITRSPLQLLQYLDVVLVVLATPVALALGAPAFGLLLAAGAWLVQRALAHVDRRWIARARPSGSRLGLDIAESFGRIWLLAGAIVVAGAVGGRADGLAAALTIFAAYSVAFATRMFSGREGFER
jgi:thiamine pyrophosphokinase